jgi:hypothetical protein
MRLFMPLFYEKATGWLYSYEPGRLRESGALPVR